MVIGAVVMVILLPPGTGASGPLILLPSNLPVPVVPEAVSTVRTFTWSGRPREAWEMLSPAGDASSGVGGLA
jgi:hypothetical protein